MKASEMIEVIQAYEDGKSIEYAPKSNPQCWNTCMSRPVWDFNRCVYRVKVEPVDFWCVVTSNVLMAAFETQQQAECQFNSLSNEAKKKCRIVHLVEVKTSE